MAIAQNLSVISTKMILSSDSEYFYPHFSPDGEKIAFTGQNFTGLYILDKGTQKTVQITDKQGAGYNPVFSNDVSTLYYRWNEYEGIRKYSSIHSVSLGDDQVSVIENRKRNLSPPQIINNKLVYTLENNARQHQLTGSVKSDVDFSSSMFLMFFP